MESPFCLPGPVPSRARDQKFLRKARIVSCGGMIGMAFLFPLASTEGPSFRTITLFAFILSALAFHSVYSEPFIRCGPSTAPVALILLLLVVFSAGPSKKDLVPWLPLFVTAWSLVTLMINKHMVMASHHLSISADYPFAGVSTDRATEYSFRSMSSQDRNQTEFESNRHNPLYFGRHGPSSRYSQRTGTFSSDISLSSVPARLQEHWDDHTMAYFDDQEMQELPREIPEPSLPRTRRDQESDPDTESVTQALETDSFLLGPQ
ncbi:hypothetical protein QBC40DRAFT_85930 [Triangularia verruculosa]|uniref:Uncharacterized protein n=1 Tax=Triangularia verruculosa TaxID=2587418 RepID=A0AAN6XFA8_9PEZI|nr:hypothetical protein QBC40DRAFT_85930 [Triangularia verruculosa]